MKRNVTIITMALLVCAIDLKTTDNGAILTKITFGGDRYSLMISDTNAADGQ